MKNLFILIIILTCLSLAGCTSASVPTVRAAEAEARFAQLSRDILSDYSIRVVKDLQTGCEYMIMTGQGANPIPLNDDQGRPTKGCKGAK